MTKQLNWANWFINHLSNDAGNRHLEAFSDVLSSGISAEAKLRDLVDEIDTVILAADANRNVMFLHSPKNFGGTRSRPDNKVSCMIGLGARGTCVLPVLQSAFADVQIVIPSVQDLGGCTSAEDIANIPVPDQNGVVGFEGSAIFIPGPLFRNAIIESNTRNPSELIPLMYQVARAFDQACGPTATSGVTHADDLCAWLYGVKTGLIPETRYSVNPDEAEVEAFNLQRHIECIIVPIGTIGPRDPTTLEGNTIAETKS